MTLDTISDTIERALTSAGLDTKSGPLKSVAETIRRALSGAGLTQSAPAQVSDLPFVERVAEKPRQTPPADFAPGAGTATERAQFLSRTHSGSAGSRAYKIFVPPNPAQKRMPLIVMLHGCKQDPDDFAAGTRMNELAERHGFLVAYPAQSANANGSNCWNWFQGADQQREGGEPAILAGIVREIAGLHAVEERRVFVAGLSAGAAMAVIMGATYPELFAGVGAHSGLPQGAAHDVASAFAAMRGAPSTWQARAAGAPHRGAAPGTSASRIPTIVFHGDKDATVNPANGETIVQRAVAAHDNDAVERTEVVTPGTATSRAHTITVHADANGRPLIEHWRVHGGTHAWSGGSSEGSYTDPRGPDASAEMVRFFLAQ